MTDMTKPDTTLKSAEQLEYDGYPNNREELERRTWLAGYKAAQERAKILEEALEFYNCGSHIAPYNETECFPVAHVIEFGKCVQEIECGQVAREALSKYRNNTGSGGNGE